IGWRLIRQTIPISTRTAKKKSNETGAKNDMREATGPGLATEGMPMAIPWALMTSGYDQTKFQPFAFRARSVGEPVPAGKSNSEKSVVMARRKFRILVVSPKE